MDAHLPLDIATLAWLAFGIGGVFGYAAQRSNFCTMGAITDILIMGDWTRLRMWALAAAVSIAGTAWLQIAGLIDVHDSIYTGIRLPWLSHIVGGLLFGIGMTLASGCGDSGQIDDVDCGEAVEPLHHLLDPDAHGAFPLAT